MEMLISAYPAQPQAPDEQTPTPSAPTTPSAEIRTEAGNPFAMFTKGLWQQRPHRQEEERLAVQSHLQTSTAAASLAAQASDPKTLPVPAVNFYDAWKATDSFSAECVLGNLSRSLHVVFVQQRERVTNIRQKGRACVCAGTCC